MTLNLFIKYTTNMFKKTYKFEKKNDLFKHYYQYVIFSHYILPIYIILKYLILVKF